jgi:tRNA-splicing ligase RtcB (3'-phosphate/5'-hydroxy nucleic acid ligase)
MKFVDTSHRIPIKSWCQELEESALRQAVHLTEIPFVYHHVSLMADCHSGYGMPIGGVIACVDAVIPNAVGVDIGCGMAAARTDLPAERLDARFVRALLNKMRKRVPVGFDHHPKPQSWKGFETAPDLGPIRSELQSAARQLGTLGGGNHFIEVQKDGDGWVWLMIHSGSRNFGYKIAAAFHRLALAFCERRKILLPDKDLAFLPLSEKNGREYLDAMGFACCFAQENRRLIFECCQEVLAETCGCAFDEHIDIHHNFAAQEIHFGKTTIVHRKGATRAEKGERGVIPGSMGTSSYVVKGLGNPESFNSCSHGAGRRMGRNEANRSLTEASVRQAMGSVVLQSWPKDRRGHVDLSEAPQAYKDIDTVIAAQSDLVEVLYKLEPIGVIKG